MATRGPFRALIAQIRASNARNRARGLQRLEVAPGCFLLLALVLGGSLMVGASCWIARALFS